MSPAPAGRQPPWLRCRCWRPVGEPLQAAPHTREIWGPKGATTWPPPPPLAKQEWPAPPRTETLGTGTPSGFSIFPSLVTSPSIRPAPAPTQVSTPSPLVEPAPATSSCSGRLFTLRLRSGAELKSSLLQFIQDEGLRRAAVVTCVGSLNCACLRISEMPAESATPASSRQLRLSEKVEICALAGMLEAGKPSCNLLLSLAKQDGSLIGGYMAENCVVNTTAEVVLVELP
eukprot:gnl/TRDRNA2_/TRDRNA2_81409_c0_seq2.p1 gnl/TRDRNA2_/TRDRNA2_81409_c0~~gnl/TRDRNA2_/TRDRNA2_81409_c0_seq2.p1  ORF type:complete len:230 (-),score=35.97 gnl/TRDRNA2_/TRDRNA2_81409_c0_seq2:149-838(-)